jgi:hypothetical protein
VAHAKGIRGRGVWGSAKCLMAAWATQQQGVGEGPGR